MKKYNGIIKFSILFFLVLAISAGICIVRMEETNNKYYKVEINRIYDSLSGEESLDRLDLSSYKLIKKVSLLLLGEIHSEAILNNFYQEDNSFGMEIIPWYDNKRLLGFLRFDYLLKENAGWKYLIILEVSLIFMELFLLSVLLILRNRLIRPFNSMCEIPQKLAQGQLAYEIKEDDSKFFGQFLWGMGQLKDKLKSEKKRRYELEREKKQMLLSLSHDIKTPLNTIKLYAKALEENLYEDESMKKKAEHQIGEKTIEIEKYVEEIMKTSREDLLDIQVKMQDFYLKDLIDKVMDTYLEKCSIRMLQLQVGTYENCLIKGDLERAQEVFENIFENAFKYGDGRRMEITFYTEDYCQLIRIFNTGSVVTENEINHIFESFYRGINSKGKQGNGLGLYICREIMRRMDGEIFAQSLEDGMAFVLVFR